MAELLTKLVELEVPYHGEDWEEGNFNTTILIKEDGEKLVKFAFEPSIDNLIQTAELQFPGVPIRNLAVGVSDDGRVVLFAESSGPLLPLS